MNWKKLLLRFAYIAAALLMLAAVVKQREMVQASFESITPSAILLVASILLFYRVANASVWSTVLTGLGASVPMVEATRVWLTTEALRWLPGGIWGFCSRVNEAQRLGVTKKLSGLSLTVELGITILAWGIAMLIGLLWSGLLMRYVEMLPTNAMLACLICGLLVAAALWLGRKRWIGMTLKNQLNSWHQLNVRWRPLAKASLLYVCLCLVNGLGFYALVQAFPIGSEPVSLAAAVGINAAAWLAGFFAIGAPGGLGAREAACAGLLLPFMTFEQGLLLAAAWRLLQMCVEGGTLAIVALERSVRGSIKLSNRTASP